MMRILFSVCTLIINISIAYAGISTSDFYGTYYMVVDGSKGILQLISFPDEKDYNLKGTYKDIETNKTYDVEGYSGHLNLDKTIEHKITFFINFNENRQKFEGYLMSKTKDALAGWTMVNKIPVGFYATKEVKPQPIKEKTERKPIIKKSIKDKISELRYILKDIRTAIMVYNGQHHSQAKLGFIWDEENKRQMDINDISAQLLERTNRNGLTKEKGADVQKLDYGPYFHKFPINPFTSGNTIHLVDSPLPIEEIVTSPKDYDWIYNLATCEFRAGGVETLPSDTPERREDNSLLDF